MTIGSIHAIGLTRWSYPFGGKGFKKTESDLDALRAQLYAPYRLDHRLFLLEHVVLPGLRDQSDQDFTHIFLMGDQLPEPWRSRVLALLATVPQIKPVFRPEGGKHKDVCREVIQAHIDPVRDVTAQYRLDDDDGVAVHFIEKAKGRFADMEKVFHEDGQIALDFNRGFVMKSSKKGIALRPVSMRFWAPGMVVFQRPDSPKCMLDFNHLRIWHYMTTLTWQDQPMFIRGAHHDNDSELGTFGRRSRKFEFKHRNPEMFFRRRFGMDLDAVKSVWEANKEHFLNTAPQSDQAKPYLRRVA